jgi:hypothetical protein
MSSLPHIGDPEEIPRLRFDVNNRIEANACLAEALEESRKCIEHGMFKLSYVSAWNGFASLALTLLSANDFAAVRVTRPDWAGDITDLASKTSGNDLVRMLNRLGLCTAIEGSTLEQLRRQRNDCAHPTMFDPGAREATDYLYAIHIAGLTLILRASRHSTT